MSKEKIAREFRKHLRYSYNLKEGGKAWEREMEICESLKKQMEDLQ